MFCVKLYYGSYNYVDLIYYTDAVKEL